MKAYTRSTVSIGRMRRVVFVMVLAALAVSAVGARETFSISTDYTIPIGNDKIDPSVGIGAEYRFWGIFTLSASMYNDIVFGADNIFDIRAVRPIGLFSGGLGLKIPIGPFDLTMDWQKFFTGTISTEGVYPFSDSFSIGGSFDMSRSFGIEVYSRKLFEFTDRAIGDPSLRIANVNDTVNVIGIGAVFHLF